MLKKGHFFAGDESEKTFKSNKAYLHGAKSAYSKNVVIDFPTQVPFSMTFEHFDILVNYDLFGDRSI